MATTEDIFITQLAEGLGRLAQLAGRPRKTYTKTLSATREKARNRLGRTATRACTDGAGGV
ncbi:unnamed protein product [Ectocarpus sp. 4 AP-2014]